MIAVAAWPARSVLTLLPRVALGREFTGAPLGTRTPNPRIKSPLLSSIIILELLSSDDNVYRYLPFCAVARIRSGLRIPCSAGAYRDIRANMERTYGAKGLDHHGRLLPGCGAEWSILPTGVLPTGPGCGAGRGHVR
jgi:hypothetical protein